MKLVGITWKINNDYGVFKQLAPIVHSIIDEKVSSEVNVSPIPLFALRNDFYDVTYEKRNLIRVDPATKPSIEVRLRVNDRFRYSVHNVVTDNTSVKLILTLRHDIFQPIYRELQHVDFRKV